MTFLTLALAFCFTFLTGCTFPGVQKADSLMGTNSSESISVPASSTIVTEWSESSSPEGKNWQEGIKEAPHSWFEWEGSTIIGLTDIGRKQSEIKFPSDCTAIKSDCFDYNAAIKAVAFANPDTNLSELYGFRWCENLERISFPANADRIYSDACAHCTSLKEIIWPPMLNTIEDFAFKECTALDEVILPDTVENIYFQTFMGCSSLKRVDLGNSLLEIQPDAFQDCVQLEEVKVPSTIQCVGERVFLNTPFNESMPEETKKMLMEAGMPEPGTDETTEQDFRDFFKEYMGGEEFS